MRLDAFIAAATGESRSIAKKYIKEKRVAVCGSVSTDSSENVDGKTVTLDGRALTVRKNVYLLLNKPVGYVSTTENIPESVLSLVPSEYRTSRLAPAGRLDKESEGLLILTDDGDFAHRIISPSKHLEKTYSVVAERPFSSFDVEAFGLGITLKDGTVCRPATLTVLKNANEAEVKITEGKYHQVRRMVASRNNRVLRLIRTAIGPYTLDGIAEGKVKEFVPEEK